MDKKLCVVKKSQESDTRYKGSNRQAEGSKELEMTTPTVTVCGSPMSPEASRAMACLFKKDMQFQNIPMLIGAGPVQVKERDRARKFYLSGEGEQGTVRKEPIGKGIYR